MTGILKDSHTKGWGPFCPVWHWFFFTMDTPTFTFCGSFFFFFLREVGLSRISSVAPFPIGRLGATQLCGISEWKLATVWHWKTHVPLTVCRLSYVCSDTVSDAGAEVCTSPLLLFGCYRAIHVKSNTPKWRFFFFCPSLLSSTAQVTPNLCLRCLSLQRCKHQAQSS